MKSKPCPSCNRKMRLEWVCRCGYYEAQCHMPPGNTDFTIGAEELWSRLEKTRNCVQQGMVFLERACEYVSPEEE